MLDVLVGLRFNLPPLLFYVCFSKVCDFVIKEVILGFFGLTLDPVLQKFEGNRIFVITNRSSLASLDKYFDLLGGPRSVSWVYKDGFKWQRGVNCVLKFRNKRVELVFLKSNDDLR